VTDIVLRRKICLGMVLLFLAAGACAQNATVRGSVKFSGTPPPRQQVKFTGDPVCERMHTGPVYHEDVVVNPNATLRNVFVYVKETPPGTYPAPAEPATLDQKGCLYVPHALGVRVNQPLKVLNSDPTLHNVHGRPKANPRFNLAMINDKVAPIQRKFAKPEPVPFKVICDVHPWMATWIGVFEHPFFAVTGDDGAFELKDLPAGDYTLVAWHEKFGAKEEGVKVGAGENKEVQFAYDGTEKPATR
jgi:hypothetical protein